jgi:dTDP-4-amino-4,6-dideoxygalactose transaminase
MITSTTAQTNSQTGMIVPLLDLRAQYAALRDELRAAVERVMESQQFILGSEVNALEAEVARYAQTSYAVGCASGSDALLLALMALEIGEGDEVITTPYSFFATVSSITRLGARPVFVDIDPRTYNIDVSRLEDAITSRTRAIMPVHLYGQCADMDALLEIGERLSITIVEDAAQAIGAEDRGRRAGSMSAIGCFSFYPTKNLGGAGDGGMMTTNDDLLAERLRVLRVHGETSKYHHAYVGINSRLDAIQAAVLRVKLPHLDRWSDARRENAARYEQLFTNAGLREELGLPFVRGHARHIFNQYVIRAGERRDDLIAHLRQHGVGAEIYYPLPLHLQECFRFLGHAEGEFPVSEQAARQTLAIPVYPELRPEQQQYVVETIRRFYRV